MIFLVGTRDSNIKNGRIFNEKCPRCNSESTLQFSIYRKYTHLTFIPLFPVGKLVYIRCENCGENFDYEDLSESIQLKLRNEKLEPSFLMFSGSVIILSLIIYAFNGYIQKNEETGILIKNPIEGDVYNLKFENGYYSTMKIDKVTTDSIYTTHNDFDAYLPYEIDEIDRSENYSNRKYSYSRKQLMKLYQDDEIIKISRPNQ